MSFVVLSLESVLAVTSHQQNLNRIKVRKNQAECKRGRGEDDSDREKKVSDRNAEK